MSNFGFNSERSFTASRQNRMFRERVKPQVLNSKTADIPSGSLVDRKKKTSRKVANALQSLKSDMHNALSSVMRAQQENTNLLVDILEEMELGTPTHPANGDLLHRAKERIDRLEHEYMPQIHRELDRLDGMTKWVFATVGVPQLNVYQHPRVDSDVVDTRIQGQTVLGSQRLYMSEHGTWMQVRMELRPWDTLWILAMDAHGQSNLRNIRFDSRQPKLPSHGEDEDEDDI